MWNSPWNLSMDRQRVKEVNYYEVLCVVCPSLVLKVHIEHRAASSCGGSKELTLRV